MLTRARFSAAVAAFALLLVVGSTVEATSATWTDPAHATAAATAGTWAVAPGTSGCVVLIDATTIDKTKTCSVGFGADSDGRADWYNIRATVSTTSTTAVLWRATINFSDTTVFGFVAKYVGEYAGNWARLPLPANFCTTSPRLVSFEGLQGRSTLKVAAGAPLTLDFVGNNSSPAGNYTVYGCP